MTSLSKKIFAVSPQKIALAALLMTLMIISVQPFMQVNFGVMRAGTEYIWIILIGLTLPLFLGLTTIVLGDTFGQLFNGGIGMWHYAYALIPIMIYLITFFLKSLHKIKSLKQILLIGTILELAMIVSLITIFSYFGGFIKYGSNQIDFTNSITKIIIWTMLGFLILLQMLITMMTYFKKNDFWKDVYITNIIVSVVIVLIIWIYGPIANILWLTSFGGHSGTNHYWKLYELYQIPRLLKTPIIMPIYIFIVATAYGVVKKVINSEENKWK